MKKVNKKERPIFDNDIANKYLDKLEALDKKFEKAINENNKIDFDECEKEYLSIPSEDVQKVLDQISKKSNYKDFLIYIAEIEDRIYIFRTHIW